MPTPRSECSFGVASETMNTLRAAVKAGGKSAEQAQKVVDDQMRFLFQQGQSTGTNASFIVESVDRGTDAVLFRLSKLKAANEEGLPFFAKTGMVMSGKKGDAIQQNLFNQYAILPAQARITGQVRSFLVAESKNRTSKFLPGDSFTRQGVQEVSTRLSVSDTYLRSLGIPLVTVKTGLKGALHASHLTFGDVVTTLLKGRADNEIAAAAFRSADPEKNVPFQNIAEAAREVIEHSDLQKGISPEDIALLKADVMDALLNNAGKSSNKEIMAAQARNKKWMNSDEGRVIIGNLAEAMTSPAVRPLLVEQNTKQMIMHMAFSRGDGFQMTDQVMTTIMNSPWAGDKVAGFGALLFDGGLQKIFGDDFLVQTSLDGSSLAFAEQFLAKAMNSLDPTSLAIIKNEFELGVAMRKSASLARAGKGGSRRPTNAARKKQGDEVAELSAKKAEQDVAMNGNARMSGSSVQGAVAAEAFYNELKYGSVIGGLAKALSKVSDKASMSAGLKEPLLGIETRLTDNAATIAAETVRLREDFVKAGVDPNALFATMRDNMGATGQSLEALIKGLPEVQRPLAEAMAGHLDRLFGVGDHNALLANGIFIDDLKMNLSSVGLIREADKLNIQKADDIADYWKQLEPDSQNDILGVMSKFFTAQQLSMVPPSMADSAARHFSHIAENLSYEEALKQGWKPMNTDSILGKYMQYGAKPSLFPPDILPKLTEVNKYLAYDISIGGGAFADFYKNVDTVTSMLKSSLTLWRPGHHMVSTVGNALFNELAGVRPWDYAIGIKVMMAKGDLTDVDVKALEELVGASAPAGMKLKEGISDTVSIPFVDANGKITISKLSLEDIRRGGDEIAAVPINARRVRDVVTADRLGMDDKRSILTTNPVSKGIGMVDHELARIAALRDNVFRWPLFVKELQKGGPYKNLDDAFLKAGQKVHEFHPTVGTLTGPERKYARRAFYFYTWQKQALFKILETAANKPAILTLPSKLQYSIATAQGLNPDSFGDPFAASGIWAAYNENSVYGPQAIDPDWGAYGFKPASPQLDIIDTLLSPIEWKPEDGLWGNIGNLASSTAMTLIGNNAAPIAKIPAELLVGARSTTQQEITNFPEYMLDNTGFGSLSRIYDWTPWGNRSDTKLDPYAFENRDRLWWNWLTGFKKTFYESPAAQRSGRQNEIDYWQKTLKRGKFAPSPSIYDVERD